MPSTERHRPAAELRRLLEAPGIIRSLGAHDVLTAMLIEQEGFETVFLGGFGVSASLLGLPDLNFITLPEMADQIRRVAARVRIPIIADGDTGHGGIPQVRRTIQEFEAAGAAGIILEDQVAPKRCGHFEGKQVVPAEEMLLRLQAALAARSDPDFVLIARTDARDTHGVEEAIRRARLYAQAGADVVFVEAPRSLEEMRSVCREVGHPLLANMLWGGRTPILSADELEALGFKIAVAPIESLLASARAVRRVARCFRDQGSVAEAADSLASFQEIKQALGVDRWLAQPDSAAADGA